MSLFCMTRTAINHQAKRHVSLSTLHGDDNNNGQSIHMIAKFHASLDSFEMSEFGDPLVDADDVIDERYESTVTSLQAQLEVLQQQLKAANAENERKEKEIASLKGQAAIPVDTMECNNGIADRLLADWLASRMEKNKAETSKNVLKALPAVRDAVDDIQRWLFTKGAGLKGVTSLIVEYCGHCRSIGLQIDRLAVSGMMFHNDVSAHSWKWEYGRKFEESDIAPAEWQQKKVIEDKSPFASLWGLNVGEYRMTRGDCAEIPAEYAWFEEDGYQDYLALPVFHRGDYTGKIAWSTKNQGGFSKDSVEIIRRTMEAFSTVLRLQTNEIVVSTLTGRLEEEVARQTQELEAANKNLAEANERVVRQYQNQLKHFAMMSHEIRTPLNCIIGLSNLLLEDDELGEESKEQVELITGSSDLLLAVVNDVLDYSKLATGAVDTSIEPTDLRKVLSTVVASVRAKAMESDLEVKERIEADIPETILTDGRRIQQIIFNLLGNAVKFGANGKCVEFNVGVYPGNALGSKEYLKFSIKDYGKGISQAEMKHIFQPFQQSCTNEPTTGGTGLGLAITRQLVRVLGGSISVDSELGKWSEFVVKLPCLRPDDGRRTSRLMLSSHMHRSATFDDSSSYFDDDDSSTGSYFSSTSFTSNPSTSVYSSSVASRPVSPIPPSYRVPLPVSSNRSDSFDEAAPAPVPSVTITSPERENKAFTASHEAAPAPLLPLSTIETNPLPAAEKPESGPPQLFTLSETGPSSSSATVKPKTAATPLFPLSTTEAPPVESENSKSVAAPLFGITKNEPSNGDTTGSASQMKENGQSDAPPAPLFDLSKPQKALNGEKSLSLLPKQEAAPVENEASKSTPAPLFEIPKNGTWTGAPAPLFPLATTESAIKSQDNGEPAAPVAPLFDLSKKQTPRDGETVRASPTSVTAPTDSEKPKSTAAPLFEAAQNGTTNGTSAPLFSSSSTESTVNGKKNGDVHARAPLFDLSQKQKPVNGKTRLRSLSSSEAAPTETETSKSTVAPLFAIAKNGTPVGGPAPLFPISKTETVKKSQENGRTAAPPGALFDLSIPKTSTLLSPLPVAGTGKYDSPTAPQKETEKGDTPPCAPALFSLTTAESTAKNKDGGEQSAPRASLSDLSKPQESAPTPLFAVSGTETTTPSDAENPKSATTPLFSVSTKANTVQRAQTVPVPTVASTVEKPTGATKPKVLPTQVEALKPKESSPQPDKTEKQKDNGVDPAATAATEEETFDDLKILVAEDNLINQKVLKRTLTRIGLKDITIVENGQLAVDATETTTFDIILMDLQMPVMDGLEATDIITNRRDGNNQSYPKVVFLTAHALKDYREKADEVGGDGFISKPFKLGTIKDTIRDLRPPK